MTRIELRFLAGRYHGTPWGRNVNEGVPEWPPSPYRLLRALYDSWKRKCPHLSEHDVRSVLEQIGSADPLFYLPPGVMAHTRAYLSNNSEDVQDKALVFDAFVAVPKSATCLMEWPDVSLTATQEQTLSALLDGLNYLGRSESWIAGQLVRWGAEGLKTCKPALLSGEQPVKGELVPVACAVAPSQYTGRRHWLEALTDSSRDVVKDRRSGPLLLRSVTYELEKNALTTWLRPNRKTTNRAYSGITLAMRAKVLPMATESVRVAELFRDALISHISKTLKRRVPGWVHGKDGTGAPERGHPHMFILPQADAMGRIDHLLIFLGDGEFAQWELDAIESVPLRWLGDPIATRIRFFGVSDHPRYRPPAQLVQSTTPFVTVRHWRKGRGTFDQFLISDVLRECRNHGLPEPAEVLPVTHLLNGDLPVHYRRKRRDDPSRPGYAFTLRFHEPVPAPFSLGYGCHFGLGQFGPCDSMGRPDA